MKIDLKVLGLAAAALMLAVPAARAQQAPSKIAIINIQNAILATKDGEKAREQIRAKFEPRSKEIEAAGGEVQKLREQLQKTANAISAEARDKLSREIDDKNKKLQWDSEDFQQDLQQEEQKLVGEIGQRMIQIIDEYAKANNYSVVLDVSSQASPVLWAATGIDITVDIVQLYDKKHGAGAAAAPAKPAAAPAKP
ncbi:MAG: OmpH family outer membrane protein [Bryobacteraceae bacterium]|nr:OmpH family outer membrane protein [Bryobacteraceae bacterium]